MHPSSLVLHSGRGMMRESSLVMREEGFVVQE